MSSDDHFTKKPGTDDLGNDLETGFDELELDTMSDDDDVEFDSDIADELNEVEQPDYGNDDLADFDTGEDKKRGGANKKLLLPVIAIVLLAGAGGYMFLGMGGNSIPAVNTNIPAMPAPTDEQVAVVDGLPQPAVNENAGDSVPADMMPMPGDMPADPLADVPPAGDNGMPPPPEAPADAQPIIDISEGAPQADPFAPVPEAPAPDAAATTPPPVDVLADIPPAPEQTAAETPVVDAAPVADAAADPVAELPPVADAPVPDTGALQSADEAAAAPVDNIAAAPVNDGTSVTPSEAAMFAAPAGVDGTAIPTGANAPVPSAAPSLESQALAAASSGPDVYYDSMAGGLPSGDMADVAGPRKVDPSIEPGQRYVVVESVQVASAPEAKVEAAGRALQLGRYEAALSMYDELYADNKRDTRILMGRAVAQHNLGRTDAAIISYEEVLDRDPKNTEAMINMLGLIRNQYPEVALRRMTELMNDHPSNPGLAAQVGVINGEMGNYADALRYLNLAASMEPSNPQHYFNMGVIADRQGIARDAVRFYEQALSVDSLHGGTSTLPRDNIYSRLSTLRGRL